MARFDGSDIVYVAGTYLQTPSVSARTNCR